MMPCPQTGIRIVPHLFNLNDQIDILVKENKIDKTAMLKRRANGYLSTRISKSCVMIS